MMKYVPVAVVIGILAIGLLILVGCKNQQARTAGTPSTPTAATTSAGTPAAVTIKPDEASCPVLGTVMKKKEMIPVDHNGKTFYLCCADCIGKFKADPEKYINHPATPTLGMSHD